MIRRWWTRARIAAVGLPVVILTMAWASLTSLSPQVDEIMDKELDNAGLVLNGEVFDDGVAAAMEAQLRRQKPRVLILGNSFARTNIDPGVVARKLEIRPERVMVFSVPNSVSSHWYAVLENRVFDKGHRPELIIVVASLQSMLTVEPYSEASRQNLLVQLDPVEAVLDPRIQRELSSIEDWRRQRLLWRQAWLDDLRDLSVRSIFGTANGAASMDRVFHHSNMARHPSRATSPVVDVRAAADAVDVTDLPSPAEGLFAEIGGLARKHDATLIWLRTPVAPRTPPERRDRVPDGYAEAAAEIVAADGHVFLDTYAMPVPGHLFSNLRHMRKNGAFQYTHAILPTLLETWARTRRVLDPSAEGASRPTPRTPLGVPLPAPLDRQSVLQAAPAAQQRASHATLAAHPLVGARPAPPIQSGSRTAASRTTPGIDTQLTAATP